MNQDGEIVIIGCAASGGTAAQFARKTDRKIGITIFEKGKYAQYSKCALPYVISGEIPSYKFGKQRRFKKDEIDKWIELQKDNK